jgi:hypothetical protein
MPFLFVARELLLTGVHPLSLQIPIAVALIVVSLPGIVVPPVVFAIALACSWCSSHRELRPGAPYRLIADELRVAPMERRHGNMPPQRLTPPQPPYTVDLIADDRD